MICVEKGIVTVNGTRIDLMAELTVIVNSLIKKGVLTVEDLNIVIKTACMSDDELTERTKNIRETMVLASMLFGDFK